LVCKNKAINNNNIKKTNDEILNNYKNSLKIQKGEGQRDNTMAKR
jgi:hypothetical protein